MFLDSLKKILFREKSGDVADRTVSPPLYTPGKGVGASEQEPSNIVITQEVLVSPSVRNLFFFIIGLLAVVALIFIIYKFVHFDVGKVSVTILGDQSVSVGKPFAFKAVIRNKNRSGVDEATLVIKVPREVSQFSANTGDLRRSNGGYEMVIGALAARTTREITFQALALGVKGTGLPFSFALSFTKGLTKTPYSISALHTVAISEDPLRVSVAQGTPTIVYNQEVKFVVNYENATNVELPNVRLEVQYPPNFLPTRYSRIPSSGTTIWELGTVRNGARGSIEIFGTFSYVADQVNPSLSAKVKFLNQQNEEVEIANDTLTFSIKEPPLLLQLSQSKFYIDPDILRHQTGTFTETPFTELDGVRRGDEILFRIKFKNTSAHPIEEVKIDATIFPDAKLIATPLTWKPFNRSLVDPLLYKDPEFVDVAHKYSLRIADWGVFDPQSNRISWDRYKYPALTIVAPGETKETAFILRINTNIPPSVANTQLKSLVTVRVHSERNSALVAGIQLTDERTVTLKLNTDLGVTTEIVKDSPYFTNLGRVPLQELVKTTFVVGFKVFNSLNPLSNIVIRAKPNYFVDFETGPFPATEKVVYDRLSNDIVWTIDSLPPGTSYYRQNEYMYIQISLTPTADLPFYYPLEDIQRGRYNPIVLLKDLRVEANDDFLNKRIGFSLGDVSYLTYITK